MKIYIANVYVDDQDMALKFYTEVLGFVKKMDKSAGDRRWITVVSPDQKNGVELLLEPAFEPARTYQKELFEGEIPFTSFAVEDIHGEYERMKELDVEFGMVPTEIGETIVAVFNDTCGNWIQLVQQ